MWIMLLGIALSLIDIFFILIVSSIKVYRCPNCSRRVKKNAKMCPQCGLKFKEEKDDNW